MQIGNIAILAEGFIAPALAGVQGRLVDDGIDVADGGVVDVSVLHFLLLLSLIWECQFITLDLKFVAMTNGIGLIIYTR